MSEQHRPASPGARDVERTDPARRRTTAWLDAALSLVPLLIAVPVIFGIVVGIWRLVSLPYPGGYDTATLDGIALFSGAGLFQDPADGYTSNVYTPLLPGLVALFDHLHFWTGWAFLFNIIGSLAVGATGAWLAWPDRVRLPVGVLRVVEAIAVGALVWWLSSTYEVYFYTDRPDALAWSLGLVGLALVPAAATRSRVAAVAAILLLSAAFWTKQTALLASAVAGLYLVGGVALRVVAWRRALVLLGALGALNLAILGVLNLLTDGWQYQLNVVIPARHPRVEGAETLPATILAIWPRVNSTIALAGMFALSMWLLALRARGRVALVLVAGSYYGAVIAAYFAVGIGQPGYGRPEQIHAVIAGLCGLAVWCGLATVAVLHVRRAGTARIWARRAVAAAAALLVLAVLAGAARHRITANLYAHLHVAAYPLAGVLAALVLVTGGLTGLALLLRAVPRERRRAWFTSAPLAQRGALPILLFALAAFPLCTYFREKGGAGDNQFLGLLFSVALLGAPGYALARRQLRTAIPAALAIVVLFILPQVVTATNPEPSAVRVAVPDLGTPTQWGEVNQDLRAWAKTHTIYEPSAGDLNARTDGIVYPNWVNLIGLLGAGEQPGQLVHAILDRRIDNVIPFAQDQVGHGLTWGFGLYEENYLWKVNQVIEAKYRPVPASSPMAAYGAYERRESPDPAPWMASCFGPFKLAGTTFRINNGGGLWCRSGSTLALKETPAPYSDVRTDTTVASISGTVRLDVPELPHSVEANFEPEEGAHWSLRMARDAKGVGAALFYNDIPAAPTVTLPKGSSVELRFGPAPATSMTTKPDGRTAIAVGVPKTWKSTVMRFAVRDPVPVSFDLSGLRLRE